MGSLLDGGDAIDVEQTIRDVPLPDERVAVSIQSGERITFGIEASVG